MPGKSLTAMPDRSWHRNSEGYADPTAGEAYDNITADERQRDAENLAKISALIPILRKTAELVGFEIYGRITLVDIKTGKKYK